MTIKVAGPILVPYTPDCDYSAGEELLTNEKIQHLVDSFKDYKFIDYEHQFTNPKSSHFLNNIGEPLRCFTLTEDLTFPDVSDTNITVPKGTAWLETVIDDDITEKEIIDNIIVAYSVTIAEKTDADTIKLVHEKHNQYLSNKSINKELNIIHDRISSKRTLIKDINDPVMLTVSVVKFPCVNKAKFCKQSIQVLDESIEFKEVDKMEDANKTFVESIKESIDTLRNSKKEEKEQEPEIEEITEPEIEEIDETITDTEEIEHITPDELYDRLSSFKTELISDIKDILTSVEKHDTEEVDEEINEVEEADEKVEEAEKTKPAKKSSVGKAFSKKSKQHIIKNKTSQPSRKTTLKHEGGKTNMKTIHERELIQNSIKGDGSALKTALKEETKILYNTREYELKPYYQHKGVLNGLNKAGKHVFQESFSEEETNKAILSTELFTQYVRELLTPENFFSIANYQTVYGEEAPIRRVRSTKSYSSQDGHLPANYYFDNIPEATELKHEKDVIRPVTQRDLFTISDRQLRNNVFGEDLLDVSLEAIKETFYNGVYGARILGDSSKEGASYTNSLGETGTVDKQFTRKDGWIKQAGQQLESGTDFDSNNIIDLFDTMYYSLPEYAQEESNYVFLVPSQVRRAYYNHFIKNSRESKIDLVSERRDLYFNDIPILTSKTLNNTEFRNMLNGGDAKIALVNPQNTLLGVGRGFGIEPERHADTSSTYYYLTLDTDAKFARPEESVTATIKKDDYLTMPVTTAENTEP